MELKSAHLKGSMRGRSKMQKIYLFICQVLISILKMINYSTYAISDDSILCWECGVFLSFSTSSSKIVISEEVLMTAQFNSISFK